MPRPSFAVFLLCLLAFPAAAPAGQRATPEQMTKLAAESRDLLDDPAAEYEKIVSRFIRPGTVWPTKSS